MKTFTFIVAGFLGCSFARAVEPPPVLNPKDKLIVETVLRLKDFDIDSSAPAKAAVLRYLRAQPGTDTSFELIERFQPVEIADDLARFCLAHAEETSGVRGAELLFAMNRGPTLQAFINSDDSQQSIAAVTLIGHVGGGHSCTWLTPLLTSPDASPAMRNAAVRALGRSRAGLQAVLELVQHGGLPVDLNFVASNVLLSADDEAIRTEAAKHLKLPATADARPLPPVADLVRLRGNSSAGEVVFRTIGTCINCHKVHGEGREVGPDLSEIGSKLSREAIFVAILDPSAAISHNFESYALLTDDGITLTGLLVSETDQSITLRTREGIDKKINRDAVELFEKQTSSLMPQDLQKLLTIDQLVNLVEYTLTLRKPGTHHTESP